MTAVLAAAAALAVITGTALYLRRRPVWQGPGVRHPGSPPRPPRQHPAPRDWGQSRLPSAADRTGQLAAIGDEAGRPQPPAEFFSCLESHIPEIPCAACGYDQRRPVDREAEGSADLDQFLPAGLYPQTLAPLPDREQQKPHACGDMPEGRVHDGCDLSDTGQQAALTAFSEPCDTVSLCRACADGACGRAVCTPGDACSCLCSTWAKPLNCPCCVDGDALRCCICERNCGSSDCRCRPAPDDTVTDMRPVPAPVAARENAAAPFSLKAHVGYVMKRKPPLREYVEATIGPGAADWNPAYAGDAAAVAVPPAEDFDSLLATARAVSDGG